MKNLTLVSICILVFFNVSAYGAEKPNIPKEIELKNKTYCDIRGGKFGHTIVLIDLTSDLKPPQIKFIKDQVFSEEFFLQKDPFTKFSYLLIDNTNPLKQEFVFTKCRPKTGGNKKLEKPTRSENKNFLKKYYNEFINASQSTREDIFKNNITSDNSLIYETIASLWQNPDHDFSEKAGKRNLIIVSDMLQFSERLDFYSICNANSIDAKCPSFKSFMKNLSDKDFLNATAPNGKGVGLKMIYLNNRYETKKELDRTLVKLWENYFKDRGFENIKTVRQLDLK
jgi:hypothetical protein